MYILYVCTFVHILLNTYNLYKYTNKRANICSNTKTKFISEHFIYLFIFLSGYSYLPKKKKSMTRYTLYKLYITKD